MKVFQTIYTSAVTTLENRQGLGRVFCSEGLPEPIREKIAHYEYDSDAGGAPIYCFERLDWSEEKWLLLNKAVPAVDYTGRTSCVSHTLAFRQSDLLEMLENWTGPIPTVFEFAKNFKWTTTWQGAPKWETEAEILTLQRAFESVRTTGQMADQNRSLAPLLVFKCGEDGIPKPKCGAWKFPGQTPDEILDQFNRVWFCVDPWSGTRKYGNHLGEPDMGRVSSWDCTFATNLRNNSPTPYEWVVLSPKVPQMPSRETLEPAIWNLLGDEEIKARIKANGISNLLVERIQEGAENWAQRRLREKLEEIANDYGRKIRKENEEFSKQADGVVEPLRARVEETKSKLEDARKNGLYQFSEDKKTYLRDTATKMESLREQVRIASKSLFDEYQMKATPIRSLLKGGRMDSSDVSTDDPVFREETQTIQSLGEEWEKIAPCSDLYEMYQTTHKAYDSWKERSDEYANAKNEAEGKYNNLYSHYASLESEKERLERQNEDLSKQQNKRQPVTKNLWFWVSCLVVVALAVTGGAFAWNFSRLTEENDLLEKQVATLKTQIANLNEDKNSIGTIGSQDSRQSSSTKGQGDSADPGAQTQPSVPAGIENSDRQIKDQKNAGAGKESNPKQNDTKDGPTRKSDGSELNPAPQDKMNVDSSSNPGDGNAPGGGLPKEPEKSSGAKDGASPLPTKSAQTGPPSEQTPAKPNSK